MMINMFKPSFDDLKKILSWSGKSKYRLGGWKIKKKNFFLKMLENDEKHVWTLFRWFKKKFFLGLANQNIDLVGENFFS